MEKDECIPPKGDLPVDTGREEPQGAVFNQKCSCHGAKDAVKDNQ